MIYFDNASTSFPKAPGVSDRVKKFIDESCFNLNRGSYSGALEVSEMVLETRELVADFFGCRRAKNVTFTGGVTHALNLALSGLLEPGDKVLTSAMEHNAVMRTLARLSGRGVNTEFANCTADGEIDLGDLEKKLRARPKALVMTHASNVCGTIMPVTEIGELCRKYGVFFVLDSAQTAGVIGIDVERDNIGVLCFTGHKAMLSVQGIGGCVFSDKAAESVKPLIYGGTGSFSDSASMPALLPDKFEAGTLNLPGIAALNCSVKYLNEKGIGNIFKREKELQNRFESGLDGIRTVRKIGAGSKNRCAVTAVDFIQTDNGGTAYRLDSEFGIMARSGLHCAPQAHKTLGTFPNGCVRFSFGHFNTEAEVDALLYALEIIGRG